MCRKLSQYTGLHEFVETLSMRARLVGEPTKAFGEKNNLALNKQSTPISLGSYCSLKPYFATSIAKVHPGVVCEFHPMLQAES